MNVADIVILIILAFGAIVGFKEGVIKKLTDFLSCNGHFPQIVVQ